METKTTREKLNSHIYNNHIRYLTILGFIILSSVMGHLMYNYYTGIAEFKKNNTNYKNISITYHNGHTEVSAKFYVLDFKEVKAEEYSDADRYLSTRHGVVPQTCARGIFFRHLKYRFYKFGERRVMCGQITILSQGDK